MEIMQELYFPLASVAVVLTAIYFNPIVSFIVAVCVVLAWPLIFSDVSILNFILVVVIYMALWWFAAYKLDKSKRIGLKNNYKKPNE